MGSAEFGGSSSASGPSTSFTANFKFDAPKLPSMPSMPGTLMLMNLNQLQNLVNEIDVANIQSAANFNGNGAGSNHVKTLKDPIAELMEYGDIGLVCFGPAIHLGPLSQ